MNEEQILIRAAEIEAEYDGEYDVDVIRELCLRLAREELEHPADDNDLTWQGSEG